MAWSISLLRRPVLVDNYHNDEPYKLPGERTVPKYQAVRRQRDAFGALIEIATGSADSVSFTRTGTHVPRHPHRYRLGDPL